MIEILKQLVQMITGLAIGVCVGLTIFTHPAIGIIAMLGILQSAYKGYQEAKESINVK